MMSLTYIIITPKEDAITISIFSIKRYIKLSTKVCCKDIGVRRCHASSNTYMNKPGLSLWHRFKNGFHIIIINSVNIN